MDPLGQVAPTPAPDDHPATGAARHVGARGHVRRAGFTAIELVVVIAVVGILVSIAAPRFLEMGGFSADRAHREALSNLRFAQRRAMNTGCPVQVDFTATGYTLSQRTGCRSGAWTQPIVDPVSNTAPFAIALPDGVALTSSVDPIVFDAVGRLTTSAGVATDATITIGGRSLAGIGETGLIHVP